MEHTKLDGPHVSVVEQERQAQNKELRWFFVCVASILIVIVAVGFAPSLYLRNIMNTMGTARPDLPVYLILHGIALTFWYLLFLAQTWLIATRHTKIHRSLGIAGAVLAVVVFSLSMMVVLRAPARDTASGASVAQISFMVIGDVGILILFAVLVTLGIRFRKRSDIHKRLMMLASVSIVAPAIIRWPGAEANAPMSIILPQLSFYAALIVYDIITKRRVHPATGWGVVAYLLVAGVSVPLSFSELGHRLVEALI